MPRPHTLPLLMLLAACSSGATGPSGRWIGSLAPATPAPECPPVRGVAQAKDGHLLFAPNEGTWVLDGTAAPDGTVTAEHTRPAVGRQSGNRQPYVTRLTGTWTPTTLDGTYTTPSCTYAVRLTRPL